MHRIASGQTTAIPVVDTKYRLVKLYESQDGYMAHIQATDLSEPINRTLKSISLDNDLIEKLQPADALQIGFYLGVESAS